MREILFRGKDYEGYWYEGNLVNVRNAKSEEESPQIVVSYDNDTFDWIQEVIPETIGQFTGLLDKNGNRIFEGDVLSIYDQYNDVWTQKGAKVVFSYNYVGGWVLESSQQKHLNIGTRTKYVQIIGNIHDNPELLEDK